MPAAAYSYKTHIVITTTKTQLTWHG